MVLSEEGYSEREISAKMQCSKTAVLKISIITGVTLKRSSPTDNSTNKFFEENLKTDVHITTVSRRLRFNFGLKSYKPARKPRLTPLMKSKRLLQKNMLLKTGLRSCFPMSVLYSSLW